MKGFKTNIFRASPPIPEIIRSGDLLVDRAVTGSNEDRFGHNDLAVTLADVIRVERPPLNVAVYAPWGSGKTGLANLLSPLIETDKRAKTKFVRYDAFKHVALPLRKHFLTFLSSKLNKKKVQALVRKKLYSSVTRTEPVITAPLREIGKLLFVFSAIFLLWLTAPAVLTWLLPGPPGTFLQALSTQFNENGTFAFFLSGITSAVAGLLRNMNFTTKEEPEVSDEQLEQLFRIVIKKSGYEKVVIFIDELDRCSPSEVVETLESVKTFFETDKCVFIVAADRQVLVEALAGHVSQATPTRLAGAEYAAASEYLDKIFGVQFSFPEMRNNRLTQYAVELSQKNSGVWTDLNSQEVISVLVPSHVVSPRRVKALMNAYTIAYRIATHRAAIGKIKFNEETSPLELAKWVALRHEFPNFASLLRLDNSACELYLKRQSGQADEIRIRDDLERAFIALDDGPVDVRLDIERSDENWQTVRSKQFMQDELIEADRTGRAGAIRHRLAELHRPD